MLLTVAICTYNRRQVLLELLGDLDGELARGSHDTIDILVVDNGSDDGTADAVAALSATMPIRVVRESRRGVAFARNRALAEARGDVIIYFDDDVRLDPGILEAYGAAFRDGTLGAAGGPVRAIWPEHVPHWVGDRAAPSFPGVTIHYDLGPGDRSLEIGDALPLSGNFAFRLDRARELGGFRTELGHFGRKRFAGGEDMEFDLRYIRRFGPMTYLAAAGVRHKVQPYHVRLSTTLRYLFGSAMAEGRYNPPGPDTPVLGRVPRWMLGSMARTTGRFVIGVLRLDSRIIVKAMGKAINHAGYVVGLYSRPAGSGQ